MRLLVALAALLLATGFGRDRSGRAAAQVVEDSLVSGARGRLCSPSTTSGHLGGLIQETHHRV